MRCPSSDIVHVTWSNIFEKCGGTILKLSFGGCFTKYPIFRHSKNRKFIFCTTKRKTSSCNIVRHLKIHMHAQYGHIITNYATILAITLVVWPESHETSNMIGHFCEGFFETLAIYQVWYFSLQICHITRHHEKDLPRLDHF